MIRYLFGRFMRIYALSFLILVLLAFIVNEYIPKNYTNELIKIWLYFNLFLVILAFFFQKKLYQLVLDNPNKLILLASIVNNDKAVDPMRLILHSKTHIPTEFETYDKNANQVLKFSQQNPYIYDISHTVYDRNFIRLSWLSIRKTNPNEFVNNLKVGDIILYHKNNSIIGFIIRFFTRCFWEHTATYTGEGYLIEASPGGVKKIKIEPWLVNNDISLGILRSDINIPRETVIELEKKIGDGYSYYKVMVHWWRIITGNTRLGFMTPIIIGLNLILFCFAYSIAILFEEYTRLQILAVLITGPYIFDSIYHKVAYLKNLNFIQKVSHEKP